MAAVMPFSFSGCSNILGFAYFLYLIETGDDRAEKEDILEFVIENESDLLQAIEDGDFSSFESHDIIKEIDPSETLVDFYCGGAGLGSATSYVGFYYTPDGNMTAIWCAPPTVDDLSPSGKGYQSTSGDNIYYTELICGNFYYYEASF